jgi:GT2 family glycosyltransferase/glycosyltransferase involved in cell wall biosynthesis
LTGPASSVLGRLVGGRRIACAAVPVLLFVSYSGRLGGAERVLLDAAAGVPGEHLLACPDGELASRARAAGLSVLTLPEAGLDLRADLRTRARALGALAGHARDVRRLARHLDPDLVVAWGMRTGIACLLAVPPTRFAPTRFALAHHDFLPGRMIAAAVRAAAARAAVVVVPSGAVARDLDPGAALGGRLRIVHPGVDADRFADSGTPAAPPEVLVLGSLTAWKRPELALEILAAARRRAPTLRLRIVGEPVTGTDPTPAALRERAARPDLAGAVEITGARPSPRAELARATCLLHCAPREPFGLVLLEAMASGRPVIAPDSAGPAEIVDESCGRLYPPGDVAAAADALVELVDDPERARAAGLAGRRRVREHFGRERTRAGFASALGEAVGSARDPQAAGPGAETLRAASSGTPAEALSLVTVTHNSERQLAVLLDSAARHLPGARVIVVDCASTDAGVERARGRPGVEVVELGENLGFGRACNRGLERVRTLVTALLNPDVELLDGSLLQLTAQTLGDTCSPRLFAPRVLNGDGSLQDTVHPLPASAADLVRSLVPPAAVPGRAGAWLAPWRAEAPRRVGWAVGCALVARTDTLRTLGPFDDSIFMYGEDLELGLRARRQGIETWLWPSARVVHRRAHSSAAAFGGEPFAVLARARHDVVARRLGRGRAGLDDLAQQLTFASRLALKRMLGRPAVRERRQLAAVQAVRRTRRTET